MTTFNEPYETPKLTKTLEAVSMIDGIDIEAALSNISGKQNILEEALRQTAYSVEAVVNIMRNALNEGDMRVFSVNAHGLRSQLASVGALKYSFLASELEAEAKSDDAQMCEKAFEGFSEMLENLAKELKAVFPAEEVGEKPQGARAVFLDAVKEAAGLLELYEADDAISCMDKLLKFTFGEETDALLAHIINKIKAFKYDEALALLTSISGS